jgi:hypothetical protein
VELRWHRLGEILANDSNEDVYAQTNSPKGRSPKLLGLGLVSAVSALAGGFAVAWWYRKTLTKLQNPIVPAGNHEKTESTDSDEEAL